MRSIACIDPFLLGDGGLKPPVEFGRSGADFITGDTQHIAIPPNFGGQVWEFSDAVITTKNRTYETLQAVTSDG